MDTFIDGWGSHTVHPKTVIYRCRYTVYFVPRLWSIYPCSLSPWSRGAFFRIIMLQTEMLVIALVAAAICLLIPANAFYACHSGGFPTDTATFF